MGTRLPDFLGSAWFIARRDVARMLRRRETLMWVLVMPVLFFYFIGTVTGGFGGSPADRRDPLAVRGARGGGFLADELLRRLADAHFAVAQPDSDAAFATFDRRLTIPRPASRASFTDAVLAGERQVVTFQSNGGSLGGDYDKVRITRAVYEVVADLAVVKNDVRTEGSVPDEAAFARLRAVPRTLTVASKPAGRRIEPPTGFSQAVPGTMVMFTMLVLLTTGAISLVVERRQGLLRRLASTPIPLGAVVFGKWIGGMMLGLVQIAVAMAMGTFLFRMNWGATWPMVGLVLFGWAAFTSSLAILLAGVTRTEAQTAGIGVLATQVLAALGGCWWPIEITPRWMQALALWLPSGWTMDAMHKLVNFGDAAAVAVPHVAALLAGAAALGWLGARNFKYE